MLTFTIFALCAALLWVVQLAALDPNEQMVTNADENQAPRVYPRRTMTQTFAAGSGTIPKYSPVAVHSGTGYWGLWDANGSNDLDVLRGITLEDRLLDASNQTQCVVMMEGDIHIDDVDLGVETLADLKTEVLTGARERGLFFEGAPQK